MQYKITIPASCATYMNNKGCSFNVNAASNLAAQISKQEVFNEITQMLEKASITYYTHVYEKLDGNLSMVSRGKCNCDLQTHEVTKHLLLRTEENVPIDTVAAMLYDAPKTLDNFIREVKRKQEFIDTPFTKEQIDHAQYLSVLELLGE